MQRRFEHLDESGFASKSVSGVTLRVTFLLNLSRFVLQYQVKDRYLGGSMVRLKLTAIGIVDRTEKSRAREWLHPIRRRSPHSSNRVRPMLRGLGLRREQRQRDQRNAARVPRAAIAGQCRRPAERPPDRERVENRLLPVCYPTGWHVLRRDGMGPENRRECSDISVPIRTKQEGKDRRKNPRYGCPYAAFRVRCIQPLCHLSARSRPALEGRACI